MELGVALGISLFLMVGVIIIHYQTLDLISKHLPKLELSSRLWIAVIIFCVYIGHIVEITVFALAYYFLNNQLGSFSTEFEPSMLNYFYFSAVNFTTVGLSSFTPQGGFKIMASLESLTGFLLITWSASFGYTAMKNFWEEADDGIDEDVKDDTETEIGEPESYGYSNDRKMSRRQ